MQILPVLDLMHGKVVRGIGGRRHEYRPIESRLTQSANPSEVAKALRAAFGFAELYLADLDAIMGQTPAWNVYQTLQTEGFELWVDAGVRGMEEAVLLDKSKIGTIIAGLETLAGPEILTELCRELGPERVVFSLDLRGGTTLGKKEAWATSDAMEIAHIAVAQGIGRLLVLDLAHVGGGTGTGTLGLCAELAKAYPQIRIAAGGGIGGMDDVHQLATCGVETVLIASALHDGRIAPIHPGRNSHVAD